MLYKKLILIFGICSLKSESSMKKSLHYYVGFVSKFLRQAKETSCLITQTTEKGTEVSIPTTADMKKEDSNVHNPLYLIYSAVPSNESYPNLIREACNESIKKSVFNHGFIFSIYLGEAFDIMSFGLCVGNENWREDCVEFSPKTGKFKSNKEEQNKEEQNQEKPKSKPKKRKNQESTDNAEEVGLIIFKRNTPLMIGLFAQVQNDDLDSYSMAFKCNLMIGIMNVHGIVKDVQSIIEKQLSNKENIFLKSELILSLSASLLLKFNDLEAFLIVGCSWAPRGITFKRDCITNHDQSEENHSDLTSSETKTNHLHFFIGLGFGFSFD